jgi:hypothetical protein
VARQNSGVEYPVAMLKLPRVAVCLPALLAVLVSGCGSTTTASTTTTTASTPTTASANTGNTGTTLPAVKAAKTATQSTAAKQPTYTPGAPPPPERPETAAEAKRERKEGALENHKEEEEVGRHSFEKGAPGQYPRFFQIRFIVSCENAKGSHSSCECILTKLEKLPGEKDKSLAELIALELEFKKGVPLRRVAGLPRLVQRITNECRSK